MRRLAALVPAVVLALAPVAAASPTPGVEQFAAVSFTLTVKRQVWTLSVEAIAPTAAGPLSVPRVRLLLQDGPPSSRPGKVFESVLRSADVTMGVDTARVSTRLGGLPLNISWATRGSLLPGVVLNTAVVGVARIAVSHVELGTTSCGPGNAQIGVRALSLLELQPAIATLDRAFTAKALRGVRCAEAFYPTNP